MLPAAVFVLLGQSNAVGHDVPMEEQDRITIPLHNVFGLSRDKNQSLTGDALTFEGYRSAGMNLGETQDDTYSLANCLAARWQQEIDAGNRAGLPDLYLIQIAIGAQGVSAPFMWYPDRPPKLVPGPLGTADISLCALTKHILSLLPDTLRQLGRTPDWLGIHWRGGEEDTTLPVEQLHQTLRGIYDTMLAGVVQALGTLPPVFLHRIVADGRMADLDPTGGALASMHYINRVFESLAADNAAVSVFDVRRCPLYDPVSRQHGIFKADATHYTPAANDWVAKELLDDYLRRQA